MIGFYHAASFSPPVTTWIDAIKNNRFSTWPKLTAQADKEYIRTPKDTFLGHMKSIRKNRISTKTKISDKEDRNPTDNSRIKKNQIEVLFFI